ncbi:ISRSO5-transposase protein, partial [mine drainage metagenome]
MNNPAPPLKLTKAQLLTLQSISKSQTSPHRLVTRSKVLLLASRGVANTTIAKDLKVGISTVRAYRNRFELEGLNDFGKVQKGRGRKVTISDGKVQEIIKLTQESTPDGQTHWSCRTMAEKVGVSKDTIQRIWSFRGLKPHQVKSFKLSNDPKFEEKLVDVVGLYLNPPDNAVVLCMDEKSSIQA